ncbi:MAG: YbjQ family protein [Gemmatimonadetes bacterium]|nr:YbjQ family protein [Gemmatimonadota bacterium]
MIGAVGLFLSAPSVSAQTLDQICPGAPNGIGALWGRVTDTAADLVLPGATVVALWNMNGEEQRSEAEVGPEGVYAMCLPLETSMTVYASFANEMGGRVSVTMTEDLTRADLSVVMTSGVAGTDDRLWLCVNDGRSVINEQFARLVRCDDDWQQLERCPKVELGSLSVQPVGAGSGMLREMIEQLVQEAKRIGANAVINLRDSRGRSSFIGTVHSTSITGEGVHIAVDPATCT